MPPTPTQLSAQIVDRLRRDLCQWGAGRALSLATGIPEPTISRIASGTRSPTTAQIDLLARHFRLRLVSSVS